MALSYISAVEQTCDKTLSEMYMEAAWQRDTDEWNNPLQHELSCSGHGFPPQSPQKINFNRQGELDLYNQVRKCCCSEGCIDIWDYPSILMLILVRAVKCIQFYALMLLSQKGDEIWLNKIKKKPRWKT